jgi:cellulose synthase/poly-beta-1,6-N-acetylglucosamine synthase-like glycosyltransferase
MRRPVLPTGVRFIAVGAAAAVAGHFLLLRLIGDGTPAALANVAVVAVTLQLNFIGSCYVTWRERLRVATLRLSQRWRRFHVARGASALVCVAGFPPLAAAIGNAAAYWTLLAAGAGVNYWSDRAWSFTHRTRPGTRFAMVAVGVVAITAAAVVWLDAFLVLTSLIMLVVATTTLVFQLYKWWRPARTDPHRYGRPDEPRLPGVILVPMRHEEAVAGHTLQRLATLNHPDYRVMPIIDHPDDPATARIAHRTAARHPGRVLVCRYPEDTDVHNKPVGLNAAVKQLYELGIPFEWIGIADAEDVFHPDLLRLVDYRFRETGAAIVQCGVQLMNFTGRAERRAGPLRRWWAEHGSTWWRGANVLEYFKWFQSRLKLQAAVRVMPLGGNTVFFRRELLDALHQRYGTWWDEDCLTEDCKIGILASVLGCTFDVVYLDHMVTQEETPPSLAGLLHQRVRWMQGFIQVFHQRDWLALPTLSQRVVAVYVLGFQFFQAFSATFAPIGLAIALTVKAPVWVALLATVPLALGVLSVLLDIIMLKQFGHKFGKRVRLADYLSLIVGAYPYQVVLSVAAVWALIRHVTDRTDWVKTDHHGAHLAPASAGAS